MTAATSSGSPRRPIGVESIQFGIELLGQALKPAPRVDRVTDSGECHGIAVAHAPHDRGASMQAYCNLQRAMKFAGVICI